MTALRKYQRLECGGLWRAAADAQRRDVTVSFGEASLVISDSRSGTPLAHWSLPAVERRNPGARPAIFSPDADAGETLEIDDPDMIGALETVARSLRRGRPAGPMLRRALAGGLAVALVLLAVFWLPQALVTHAVRVLPQAKKAEIGALVLSDLERAGHEICTAPLGLRALARLQERLGGVGLVVLAGPVAPAAMALPGGGVALGEAVIGDHDTPEVAAGHVLAALAGAEAEDPLVPALRAAGLYGTLMLLITGDLPEGALRGYGARLKTRPPPKPPAEALLQRFAAAEISVAPYAYALDPSGETTLALIEADPHRDTPPRQVLADGDWVSLQGICQR